MVKSEDIRMLLVDDHMMVRKGIVYVLSSVTGFEIVGEAENGERALYLTGKLNPDVILMDVKMDGLGGIETTRLISHYHPDIPIIGVTSFHTPRIVKQMMEAGACGYVLKEVSASDLIDTIRRVHAGEKRFPESLLAEPGDRGSIDEEAEAFSEDQSINALHNLGDQQKRVLALMAKGLTNPEIASQLNISQSTARYHVSAILHKLDVSNRAEAVALAVRADFA